MELIDLKPAHVDARGSITDLVADDETLTSFYAARIPRQVASSRSFARWWKDAERNHDAALDWPLDIAASGPLPACPLVTWSTPPSTSPHTSPSFPAHPRSCSWWR